MIYDLSAMTSPEAAEAVARSRTAVIPIGSIEQHGPHLPNGTDTMAAELVARAVADRLDAVYAPFGPYGVTPIHAGHPGTVTLRRETFEALLTDICSELVGMGVHTVVLVNWHEGNIASMNAVATDLQDRLRRHVRRRAGLLRRPAALSRRRRRAHPRRWHRDARRDGATTRASPRSSAPASRPGRRAPRRWT